MIAYKFTGLDKTNKRILFELFPALHKEKVAFMWVSDESKEGIIVANFEKEFNMDEQA